MAPRPAADRRVRQNRQPSATFSNRIESLITTLNGVVAATTLGSYVLQPGEDQFHLLHAADFHLLMRPDGDPVLVELFYAVAHGMQLVQRQLSSGSSSSSSSSSNNKLGPAEIQGLAALCQITEVLNKFMQTAVDAGDLAAEARPLRIWLSTQFATAGLPLLVEHLCGLLTQMITAAEQQQQQQPLLLYQELKDSGLWQLAHQVLLIGYWIGRVWPSQLALVTPTLTPMTIAAAGLAVAVLRSPPEWLPAAVCSNSSGSSSSSAAPAPQPWHDHMHLHTCIAVAAVSFGGCICNGLVGIIDPADSTAAAHDSSSQPADAAPAEELAVPDAICHSRAVAELLLIWMAITVRSLHFKQQGLPAADAHATLEQYQAAVRASSSLEATHAAAAAAGERLQADAAPVPAYHEDLLRLLRVRNDAVLLHFPPAVAQALGAAAMVQFMQVTTLGEAGDASSGQEHRGSSSSSSSRTAQHPTGVIQQQQQQQQVVQVPVADVVSGLLLVSVELMLLQPAVSVLMNGIVAMMSFHFRNNRLWAAQSVVQQGVARVLPPVLQLLLPAVQRAQATAEKKRPVQRQEEGLQSAAGDSLQPLEALGLLIVSLSQGAVSADDTGEHGDALTAVCQQHMEQFCLLLEAAVRYNWRRQSIREREKAVFVSCKLLLVPPRAKDSCQAAPCTASASASAAASAEAAGGADLGLISGPSGAPAAAAGRPAAQPDTTGSCLQRLFALLISCLKSSSVQAKVGQSYLDQFKPTWSLIQGLHILTIVALNGLLQAGQHCAGSGTSTAHRTASDGNGGAAPEDPAATSGAVLALAASPAVSQQLCCVALARSLVMTGKALQGCDAFSDDGANGGGGNDDVDDVFLEMFKSIFNDVFVGGNREVNNGDVMDCFQRLLPICISGGNALAQHLAALAADSSSLLGADAAVLQQLCCEGNQLVVNSKDLLRDAFDICSDSDWESDSDTDYPTNQQTQDMAWKLGEQLEAWGAAVCAQLPVQQCCNYHGCTNSTRVTELELVSGKSCVCGGCRVARYCSSDCQKAHWYGWHKTVCKRIQQQQQQQ